MTLTITLVKEASEGAVAVEAVATEAVASHPLSGFLGSAGFTGAVGDKVAVPDADGGARILVGAGSDSSRSVHDLRSLGGVVAGAAKRHAVIALDVAGVVGDLPPGPAARSLAEGLALGAYTYTALRSDPKPSALTTVEIVGKGGKRVQDALDLGVQVADAVSIARDLVNEPGGTLTAPVLAKQAQVLGTRYGFHVDVLGPKEIKAAKMGGLLGVNRGSTIEPRFLELHWTPAGKPRGSVALVGKGITFDSGGLSLKPSEGMLTMKSDMGGGAAVIGAFCALAAVQPKVEVRGYVPLTDNMPGPDATRLGDVLTYANGKTVEIHNTDAEGRLILADALIRASEAAPNAIIDLATLTGACMIALGKTHAGVMGNHQGWIDQVLEASASSDEAAWPLPMPADWRKSLDSSVADLRNIGNRDGGASVAALFLQEFVGDGIPWVHVDIAGPSFTDTESPLSAKGGTGYGVRLLLDALVNYRKP